MSDWTCKMRDICGGVPRHQLLSGYVQDLLICEIISERTAHHLHRRIRACLKKEEAEHEQRLKAQTPQPLIHYIFAPHHQPTGPQPTEPSQAAGKKAWKRLKKQALKRLGKPKKRLPTQNRIKKRKPNRKSFQQKKA
jgi:hypothetical protein